MGIEYYCQTVLNLAQIETIKANITASSEYQLLNCDDEKKIHLRFTNKHFDKGWPEDVEIDFNSGVSILFHSGNTLDRDSLILKIKIILQEYFEKVEFYEE